MTVAVRQLHPLFVGEVSGVDLRRPLDQARFAEIEAAFDRYAVLVFPGEPLEAAQQIAFSERFGRLEAKTTRVMRRAQKLRLGSEFSDISNLDENNALMAANDRRLMFGLANQLWHTDSSFTEVPAKASLLSAHVIPPAGGETEFADLRAAYDALAPALQQRIEGLVAEHSIFHSRAKLGYTDFTAEERAGLPPVQQVLVRTHPGSGRKTLYLASHASHIIGWPRAEGENLIAELMAFATQRRFVYRHRWRVGDLVMWDNRCTMHRGMPWDMQKYPRDLRRTTVEDVGPTVPRLADQAVALG